jgi:hypothetical protein
MSERGDQLLEAHRAAEGDRIALLVVVEVMISGIAIALMLQRCVVVAATDRPRACWRARSLSATLTGSQCGCWAGVSFRIARRRAM